MSPQHALYKKAERCAHSSILPFYWFDLIDVPTSLVRRSSFVVRRSSFVVRRSSFVVRRSSFVVRRNYI
ncbi:hypothetical protein ACE3MZ_04620 [Paenibacillus sp. WLX1005]|uniref:hypothetical protein n=1 Tax=Paenibacillus sp. WLX1005 TaxID=3243766 RepID=UPI003983EBA9